MNYYMAIDIGASSGRHIVGWLEGGKLKTEELYRFTNGTEIKGGRLVWDTERLFNEVFGGLFTGNEIAWMKNEPKTLGFMAEFRDMEKKMKLSDFPAMLKETNELFLQ